MAVGHAAAWRLAVDGMRPAPAGAGTRRVAWLAVARTAVPPADAAPRHAGPPARPAPPADRPRRTAPGKPTVPPRGGGGPARRAGPAAWPVYPTRPPPPAALHYALAYALPPAGTRPAASGAGRADIAWTRDALGFALRLSTRPEGREAREWLSTGGFDAAGVAPARLAERARGRDRRAVDFDRTAGRVRFTSAPGAPATAAGVQDRWSWIAQLAAIAEGAGARVIPGTAWTLQVAGLRGELDPWVFRVLDSAQPPDAAGAVPALPPGGRAPALLHVLRTPGRPYDLRVEAWLSPALHHFPAALRMSTPPSGWSLVLRLDERGEDGPGAPNAP